MNVREHIRIAFDKNGEPHVTHAPCAEPADGIILPGWDCQRCRCFNGEAVQVHLTCRFCGAERPVVGGVVDGMRACGDIDPHQCVVICECGLYRQADRPHGFVAPVGGAP